LSITTIWHTYNSTNFLSPVYSIFFT